MESGKAAGADEEMPGASLYGLYVAGIAVSGLGNLLIRVGARGGWLSPTLQVVLAVAITVPLAFAAVLFWRLLRRDLDEMLQRIVLEGMAFALVVFIPLAALYMNVETAQAWTPRLDPPDILLLPAVLVALGIVLARRRYS